jgi:hypothetical protein
MVSSGKVSRQGCFDAYIISYNIIWNSDLYLIQKVIADLDVPTLPCLCTDPA